MTLSEFIDACDEMGEVQRISGASTEREIGALTEMNARGDQPKLLVFDDVPGHPSGRVVSGVLSSPRRLSLALGQDIRSTEELVQWFRGGRARSWFSKAADYAPTIVDRPAAVRSLPLQSDGLNVQSYPTPLWHPLDGGRYILTGGYVLTRDPESGWINAGAYRLMVRGDSRLSLWMATSRHGKSHLQAWWKQGKPCPVVAVLGDFPLVPMLAGVEVPDGVSELNVAGAASGAPLQAFAGALTGLPIPTTVDLAMEGFAYPDDMTEEGPFGEGTGYYAGGVHKVPAIQVERIYQREHPIMLGAPPGKPPHDFEYQLSVVRSALIHDALEASGVTGVQGVWSSYARELVVVAVKQQHPGHGRQAAMVAAHCGPGAYMARYVIAVDEDINPIDLKDVAWALVTRSDPANDIEIVRRGWGSPIDPQGHLWDEGFAYNSRAIIDACIPYTKRDVFPAVAASDPDDLREIARKWSHVLQR